MPFKEPPLDLNYFADYIVRVKRGLINAEWKFQNHPFYNQFSLELNDSIEKLNILLYNINTIKNHENSQKTQF